MRLSPSLLFFLLVFSSTSLLGQDQHFTQFYASALTLNPALSGAFDGGYRLSTVYRDQGKSILDAPYNTFSGAVDLRFPVKSKAKTGKDAFGTGVIFYSDHSAATNFYTNQIGLTGSFHKALDRKGDQFLSAGVQFGISQRNVNYENITFHDQFHIVDGYVYATEENLPVNNFAFGELSAGIHYSYAPDRRPAIFAGLAAYHLLEPSVSFYGNEDISGTKLYRKYVAHVGLLVPMGIHLQFSPRALVYMQGPHLAANAGANWRFLLQESKGYALHLGGWVRPVRNAAKVVGLDAAIAMIGIEHSNFLIGMSYDIGLSTLNLNSNRVGAFELSIAFLGNYNNETILCPKF